MIRRFQVEEARPASISGYLSKRDAFDEALATFSVAYASFISPPLASSQCMHVSMRNASPELVTTGS